MKELVLNLFTSYENRISMVDELVSGAHYAMATLDVSLAAVAEDRARLKTGLQEILARNCSLRRKDFNTLMERIISDSEMKKRGLEEERKRVREELKGYLDEQKQLISSLRQQLVDSTDENADKDALEATIANMKVVYQRKSQQVFALLCDFQLRLEAFQKEQEEINQKLQKLVERGEALRLEDLRQLQAAKAGQERRAERELRRQEVERLLAHFKGQRQEAAATGDSKNLTKKEAKGGNRIKHEGTDPRHCFFPGGKDKQNRGDKGGGKAGEGRGPGLNKGVSSRS